MSEANPLPPERVTELQVSAHLMQLDAGVYCVHHAPGSPPPDPQTGLPSARLSLPPGATGSGVSISGFRDDGWLGTLDAAALVRVTQGPAQVLMTIYQSAGANQPPRLQVTKLVEGAPALPPRTAAPFPTAPSSASAPLPDLAAEEAEIAAHIQDRGDVLARLGSWVGDRGSQRWVEGFTLSPRGGVAPEDIEYQAVLGRGWLSPWAAGTQYCGSRGMALPILGLCVRLRGQAATTHTIRVSATFTDGAAIGPVGPGDACEVESLAPLEAFKIELVALRKKAARATRASATPAQAKATPAQVKAAPAQAKAAPPTRKLRGHPAKPAAKPKGSRR